MNIIKNYKINTILLCYNINKFMKNKKNIMMLKMKI